MKIIRPYTIAESVLTSTNVVETDYSAWVANTPYAVYDRVIETSPSSSVSISIGFPCIVSWPSHGRAENTPVVFTTTGSLPTGVVAGQEYYVRTLNADSFYLSDVSGGSPITTSGSQSGTHTATCRVHKIYESTVGARSAVTITIATPGVVSWTSHGFAAGDPISFTTTGALPTGITAGVVYYVLAPTTNSFNIAATAGGSAIATSGTQSGTHTATATPAASFSKQPAINTTQWLEVGSTNRWKMFDQSVTSQTSNLSTIDTTFTVTGRVDTVTLLNVDCQTARVKVSTLAAGTVYDTTISGISDNGITDWYAYFFEPIENITDIAFTDLPPYANPTVEVILTNTGNMVACGGCVLGLSKDIGDTQVSAKVGIQDYSVKQRNSFGDYTVLQRAFNKRANFTIYSESSLVDKIQNLLAAYRATPIVYIGSEDYGSSIVYGFYKNFEIDIGYYDGLSVCTLEVEGLT